MSRRFFLLMVLFIALGVAEAQEFLPQSKAKEVTQVLDGIDQVLGRESDAAALATWSQQTTGFREEARICVTGADRRLEQLRKDLETLGPRVEGEDSAVTGKRRAVENERAAVEKQLASCRLLLLRGEEVLKRIDQRRQEILARHLLARGPQIHTLVADNWVQSGDWLDGTRDFIAEHSGVTHLSPGMWVVLGLVALGSAGAALWLRARILWRLAARAPPLSFSGRLRRAGLSTLARHARNILVSASVAGLIWLFVEGARVPFVGLVAYGLPVYFLLIATVQFFLAPPMPAEPFLNLEEGLSRSLARRLQLLALLVYLGYLLFSTVLWQSLPEPALLLARAVFSGVLALNLIWVIWLFGRLPLFAELGWLRFGVMLLLIGIVGAEWAGYRNLSIFLLQGMLGTLLVAGFGLLISRLFHDLYDGLDSGVRRWHREIRRFLGLAPLAPFPGLTWLRFLTTVAVWAAVGLAVLTVWGFSEGALKETRAFFVEGFSLGSLHVNPSRILLAFLILALLLPISRWLRTRMEKHWLRRTYMERGAREAMVTISGYLVVGVAVVLALAVAGMDFGNLAIIAGALSVGIGFGLQNIVNNFVSGLILLFERPVKTGDWVVVGETEGYVKRISIRSTQIQTFDRADVIVPNSELISHQVTNWMLRDPYGRVVVPVGVAYGSDTKKVKEVLLEVARAHPEVLTGGPLPDPYVLFRRFGNSALEFELRGYVQNVDNRLTVTSDLNFAIDHAFRAHGIEIPFSKRDIYIKSWPASESGEPAAPARDHDRGETNE